MSQVKKTMAQGFADGKELYEFYTGIAQDAAKIPTYKAISAVVSCTSSGAGDFGGALIGASWDVTDEVAIGDFFAMTTAAASTLGIKVAGVVVHSSADDSFRINSRYNTSVADAGAQGYVLKPSFASIVTTT